PQPNLYPSPCEPNPTPTQRSYHPNQTYTQGLCDPNPTPTHPGYRYTHRPAYYSLSIILLLIK
ncbi:hypothetical protein BKA66DRAFT_581327, partial [Pyrenochaeta sp. MPI-SDFR-AT-0127]